LKRTASQGGSQGCQSYAEEQETVSDLNFQHQNTMLIVYFSKIFLTTDKK